MEKTLDTSEKIMSIIAGLITVITFFLSVQVSDSPSKESFGILLSLNEKLQNLPSALKLFIFFISEIANGYFFSILIQITEKYNHVEKLSDVNYLLIILLCIVSSAFLSFLFLDMSIFNNKVIGWDSLKFFILYLISYFITIAFIVASP